MSSSTMVIWWSSAREDAFAGVGGADAEMVHAAGAADAHLAALLEAVVAQPVVRLGACASGTALEVARWV